MDSINTEKTTIVRYVMLIICSYLFIYLFIYLFYFFVLEN